MHIIFDNKKHALIIVDMFLDFDNKLVNHNHDLIFDSLHFIVKHIEV